MKYFVQGISRRSRNSIDVMYVIIQVQRTLVSETTDESIILISLIGKCDDPRVLILVLQYSIVKKKVQVIKNS